MNHACISTVQCSRGIIRYFEWMAQWLPHGIRESEYVSVKGPSLQNGA
jgi:hypothetical protein